MSTELNGKRKLSENEEKQENSSKKARTIEEQPAGVLLFSGLTNYNERNDPKISKNPAIKWSPIRFDSLDGIRIREVSSGSVSYHWFAISEDYKVYAWGFNSKGELGLNDCVYRSNPTLVESLSGYKIVAIATGRHHSLFLTDNGIVLSCGDNSHGECGVGSKEQAVLKPKRVDYDNLPIVRIACGAEFSLVLSEDGVVYSFGHPEYGQLGHGTENKEIAAKKEVFHYQYSPKPIESYREIDADNGEVTHHGQPHVVEIACGVNHCCAIDNQTRLFTWGFGGYGRLGHNDTRNEFFPRLMRCWYRITGRADGGITKVSCGSQFNMVQTTVPKCTLLFGQINLSGEANMYPKFVEDLNGWNVRHIVCGQRGYTVCADNSVIACHGSPGYGTLGMGEKQKSSAPPILVKTLKDVYTYRCGLGYMHATFIVRDDTEKDKAAIEKFPSVTLDDVTDALEETAPKKGAASKGKKGAAAATKGKGGKATRGKGKKK